MKKQIINRVLLGFPIGICISILITIIISLKSGYGVYIPVPPQLSKDIGNELNAFIFQLILSGFFGSILAGISTIWDTEWSLLKMTLIHFLITTTSSLPVAYLLRWVPRNVEGILSFYIIFITIYIVIWIILFFIIKRQIKKINSKL